MKYLKTIETKDNRKFFLFDFPICKGINLPIKTKLTELKIVPRTNPLPSARKPIKIRVKPIIIAVIKAFEQYFFWVCLIDPICQIDACQYLLAQESRDNK
mmetsp:Transcript_18460/g.8611  ORF Transcript_18460/g.8611 Transcript_18460/m.8611 type:complete len:100 (+) Transcript_18460:1119-1418(+)